MRHTRTGPEKGTKISQRTRSVVAAFFAGLGFASLGVAQTPVPAQSPAVAAKRIFRIAVEGPIASLDPALAESNGELMVAGNLVEPLLARDIASGLLKPAAAESYVVSEDGKTVTFTLRSDLFWSNGERVTAADFVYSLRRLLAPQTDAWAADFLSSIRGAEDFHDGAIMGPDQLGIRAEGDRKLVVELAEPDAFLPDFFAQPATAPVRKASVERFKSAWSRPENWVGSGPFVSAGKGELIHILRKNPHHRLAGAIQLDEVHVFLVGSRQEGTRMYMDGKVDQFGYRDFGVSDAKLSELAGRKDLQFEPDLRTGFLRFNRLKPPLATAKIREAIAMAIDRNLLKRGIVLEGEEAAYSMIPDRATAYDSPRGFLFNVPGARKLLKDLGICTRGTSPGTSCKPFPVLSLIHRGGLKGKKIGLALEAMLKKSIGISGLEVVEKTSDDFDRALKEGNYILALDEASVLAERPYGFLEEFTGQEGKKSDYDSLVFAAKLSPTFADAIPFLRRAESLLMQEGGIVPIYHGAIPILVSPRVKGYLPNIWDVHPLSELSLSP